MATVVRAQFSDWLGITSALPWLRTVTESGRKRRPEWFQQVFRQESTDRPAEQYTSIAKFGTVVETDEGAAVTYDSPLQGFDATLTPLQYSLGYKISKIAFDDDRIGPLKSMASDLGWSWTESRNIITADEFNNGFSTSYPTPDGAIALFSTSHVHEDGSTFRNTLATAADFSISSFRTAMIDFRNFRDGRGKRLSLMPESILIPPDGYFDVAEVIESDQRPDNANNAKNVQRGFFGGQPMNIIVCDYLTDTDSWFLIGPKEDHGLVFLEREAFNVVNDVDFDTRTMKTAAWGRFTVGKVNNGVGIYGSPGA